MRDVPSCRALGLAAAVLCLSASAASAATVTFISEDFEAGNLDQWTGQNNGGHHGVIVADPAAIPLSAGNNVVKFTATQGGGDMFSIDTLFSATQQFRVSFDYLGLPANQNNAGYFGFSQGFPGAHDWLAYQGSPYVNLVNNGEWQHYDHVFTPGVGTVVHLMFEDFSGVPGDAYFDNFVAAAPDDFPALVTTPEPSSAALMLFGVAGFVLRRRRARVTR